MKTFIACAMFVTILSPSGSWADGGVVRAREIRGSLIVTVFTPAQLSSTLPEEVSVLVQNAESAEALIDAVVDVSFIPPDDAKFVTVEASCSSHGKAQMPATVRLARGQASNKLLYATTVVLRAAGNWQMRVVVRRGGEDTNVACLLPVVTTSSRLAGLWLQLALPPVSIGLFALNHRLRRR